MTRTERDDCLGTEEDGAVTDVLHVAVVAVVEHLSLHISEERGRERERGKRREKESESRERKKE